MTRLPGCCPTVASSWITPIPKSKTKPARFQAVYRDTNGRQRSAGIHATKREAKRALAAITAALDCGDWIDPTLGRTRFDAYAAAWLKAKQVSPATLVKLEGVVRRELVPPFGKMQLKDITPIVVRGWVATLSPRLAPATVRGLVATLSSVLSDAVDDGYLQTSPVRLKHGDLPRVTASDKMFLTVPQIKKLIVSTDEFYRPLIHFTAWTGMRWGEVTALRWEDTLLADKLARVTRAASLGPGAELLYGPPKTEASRREITLDARTVRLLREHKLATQSYGRTGLVFTTPSGRPLRANYFRPKVWMPAVVAAFGAGASGLERSCPTCLALPGSRCRTPKGVAVLVAHKPRHEAKLPTFHDLRHSYISHLLVSGLDPVTVSRMAGHSSTQMTLDVYGRLRADHALAVSSAIDRLSEDGS